MENLHENFDTILTLDFGSQYTHLITRRLRELKIYSELLPCTQDIKKLSYTPKGIILSGGPYSVYDIDAPHVNPEIFDLGIPILGICYGLQEIAWHHGKNVIPGIEREYGLANVMAHSNQENFENKLFHGFQENDLKVWMSHGDKLGHLPDSFRVLASTKNAPLAGIAHESKPIYGIQFHPEVTHTPRGAELLRNFAVNICAVKQEWTMDSFIMRAKEIIRSMVGDQYEVLGAVSGGVDSTVAAKIMHDAIGDRFHAILVDNGCMRLNECEQVREILNKELGINLTLVDASSLFLNGLRGILDDPEAKRKFIGETFIDVFEAEVTKLEAAAVNTPRAGKIKFFLQGTLYPDVIESVSFKGPSATIKTHHNVGGLPKRMIDGHGLKLIEPLRELFKDEVREIGRQLGISDDLVMRHPFPGPGIAIRVLGEVTPEQVAIVRKADHIFIQEIRNAGLYNKISQAYAALLPVKAVGVMGDKRVHQQVISLRAVQTTDYMTANIFRFDWDFLEKISSRICNEVEGVCRVVYDMTSKPPGTIEME